MRKKYPRRGWRRNLVYASGYRVLQPYFVRVTNPDEYEYLDRRYMPSLYMRPWIGVGAYQVSDI